MQTIQPRSKFNYKEPRRLNGVSLSIMLIVTVLGYLVYAIWPVFSLRSNVESELGDALPNLWKLNLQSSDPSVRGHIHTLKRTVAQRLRQVGVTDKKLEVVIERNKKIVAMEARFQAPFTIPLLDKTILLSFSPRVETDAARVDW